MKTDDVAYNLAIAFQNFATAYTELVKLTNRQPDLDVSEAYPFYLLDFEDITANVVNWCQLNITKQLTLLPQLIVNPFCLTCAAFCNCNDDACTYKSYINFSREVVEPFLIHSGYKITADMPDGIVHAAYIGAVKNVQHTIASTRKTEEKNNAAVDQSN